MSVFIEYTVYILAIISCIIIGIIGTFINFVMMMFFRLVYLFSRNKNYDIIARKHKYNIINTISII